MKETPAKESVIVRLLYRLVGAVIGLLAGILLLLIIYYLIRAGMEFFDVRRVRARVPVSLFILPLVTMIYGLRIGPDLVALIQDLLGNTGPLTRLVLIGPLFWGIVVIAYVFVFEPFGYYTRTDDWIFVAKIILFPAMVLWVGAWVVKQIILRK